MENLIDSYTIRASNTGDGETEKLMAVSDILLLLKKTRLFQGLHDHEIDQICEYAMLSERAYEKDKIIINQGEQVRKIGIIKSGSIIGVKYHYNGDSQIMRIYNQGEEDQSLKLLYLLLHICDNQQVPVQSNGTIVSEIRQDY